MMMTRRGFLLGSAATLQYKRLTWMTGLCQFIAQPSRLTLERLRAVSKGIEIDMRPPARTAAVTVTWRGRKFGERHEREGEMLVNLELREARVDMQRVLDTAVAGGWNGETLSAFNISGGHLGNSKIATHILGRRA